MNPRWLLFALPLVAAACVDEPDDPGLDEIGQAIDYTDAGRQAEPGDVLTMVVADGSGHTTEGVRVGAETVLISTRTFDPTAAGHTVTLGGSFTVGWYTNVHPALALEIVQREPNHDELDTKIVTIDRRPGNVPFGDLRCGTHIIHPTSSNDAVVTVTNPGFTGIARGAACFTDTLDFVGFVDAVTWSNLTVVRASPAFDWIFNIRLLGQARLAATVTTFPRVQGPFVLYVAPDPAHHMCLDVPGGAVSPATVNQFPCHLGKTQQFFLDYRVDFSHPRLLSNQSGLCVDVPGGVTTSGTSLQQFGCHTGGNQRFTLESPTVPPTPKPYRYHLVHAPSLCMAARTGVDALTGGLSIRQMNCTWPMGSQELWVAQPVAPS